MEITSLVAQKAANLSTSVVIESFAIAAEGVRFEFASHDERRSWEYAHGSLPTSLDTRRADGFGGAMVGPRRAGDWRHLHEITITNESTEPQLAMTMLMTSDMANFSGNVARWHDTEALSTKTRDVAPSLMSVHAKNCQAAMGWAHRADESFLGLIPGKNHTLVRGETKVEGEPATKHSRVISKS